MSRKKDKKVLVIPDVHIPYHDSKALDLVLKAGKAFKPDAIVILGDFIDNYSISRYDKDPRRDRFLKWEVDEANKILDKIDKMFPRADKIFMEGNHEERLNKFITTKAPELFGLVDTQALLGLKDRGYKYFPYGKHHKLGKLVVIHGTFSRKNIARAMLDKYEHSVCFGHVHTIEEALKVNEMGEAHVAFTPGWLGDKTKADYIKDFSNWSLGFATVIVKPSGIFFHNIHRIVNYKCRLNDKIISG